MFHDQYADKIVTSWYNQKGRRMHQGKRKEYKKRLSSKKTRETFDVASFTLDVEDDSSDSDSYDDDISSDENDA